MEGKEEERKEGRKGRKKGQRERGKEGKKEETGKEGPVTSVRLPHTISPSITWKYILLSWDPCPVPKA